MYMNTNMKDTGELADPPLFFLSSGMHTFHQENLGAT